MGEAKHVPGPWKVQNMYNVTSANGIRGIATCGGCSDSGRLMDSLNENTANAHLIAAAPELYEALKAWQKMSLLEWIQKNCDDTRAQRDFELAKEKFESLANNALAKAEGKTK